MKNFFEKLSKITDDFKKTLSEKKNLNLKKVETFKESISSELDKELTRVKNKKNLLKEAKKQKLELKKYKTDFLSYISSIKLRYIISIPFIGSMIIPAIIMHIFAEIYHRTCFPLYGIPKLKARDYFIFDRQHLSYLNWLEKLFCIYCSYFNNLIAYVRDMAALTELYWCPIKHAKRINKRHNQYYKFVDYINAEEYRKNKKKLRKEAKKNNKGAI
ncbi:hypothetical protein GF354_02865 [Candidatus Peregrinibacteria bacterium]|nr:hypothetical protein [Candidatus Peregrinibacteria bacterium]